MDSSAYRAQHVGDHMDPQGEQMNLDDLADLQTLEFSDRHPGLLCEDKKRLSRSALPNIKLMQP